MNLFAYVWRMPNLKIKSCTLKVYCSSYEQPNSCNIQKKEGLLFDFIKMMYLTRL